MSPAEKKRVVEQHVTRRFLTLYGLPKTDDPDAFVAEYHTALEGTDADILRTAMDAVVKRQKFKVWPSVGDCAEMVNIVAADRERRAHRPEAPILREREPTREERARVRALLGELAAKLRADEQPAVAHELPRADRDAWNQHMATSEIARELSLPRNLRRI